MELGGPDDEAVAVVWSGRKASRAAEYALVLSAAGIDYDRVVGPPHGWLLVVPQSQASRAAEEIRVYQAEHLERVPRLPPLPAHPGAWNGVVAFALIISIISLFAWNDVGGLDWLGAGELEAGRVLDRQYWRVVTALTLHANLGHLGGNLLFGSFFGWFAARYFGAGLAWLAIVVSAAAANLLNAWIQSVQHRSIGASTAVFAALGLLTAHAWFRNVEWVSWRARVGPIGAGVGLLVFLGLGGKHTDVLAHLLGFAVGFVIGALLSRAPRLQMSALQLPYALLACSLVVCAWLWGLTIAG